MDPRAFARRFRRHDDEAAVDLRAVVHPGGIFLADIAALGEADSVQLGGIAFEPEKVGQFRAALSDAEPEPVFEHVALVPSTYFVAAAASLTAATQRNARAMIAVASARPSRAEVGAGTSSDPACIVTR
jgi:hypothetical protein